MKSSITGRLFKISFLCLIVLTITSTVCSAQEWTRAGRGEIFAFGQFMGGDTATATVDDSVISMKFDDMFAGGIGFGYNFSNYFNVNMDLLYGQSDTTSSGFDISIKHNTNIIAGDLNLDFNILKTRFTPLVTGGIGYVRFKGTIAEGFDFDEVDLSYNVGGGIRWDVTDHFLVKAVYRSLWTKLKDTDKAIRFNVGTLSIGYIF